MINKTEFVDPCAEKIDLFLESHDINIASKQKFRVDISSHGYVYRLGHYGVEITCHQFIIFSKFNSRHIEMIDYASIDELLDYVLPIILDFEQNPEITKHIFVRTFLQFKKKLTST